MKARAPPPPQAPLPAPRHIFRNTVPDGGGTSSMDTKENVLRPTVDLQLTLPQGYQTSVTEDGSKALMDLLVELCSRYHLNPALHTLELLTPEGHTLGFKPNALLGSLNVACVLIKEKVWEEKVVRRPAPKVPEKTVRLMVNYHGSQKAVVRVNPLVPLQALIPVICEKCEFDPAHVLLLKDSISRHELPLNTSLTELGIKELYVHDQSLVLQPKMASAPALNYSDSIRSSTASLGRAEKKGLLGIFQFSRRKNKRETTSLDMDDCDDNVIQNTDTQSNGLSTGSGVPSVEDRPSTLGQSQSAMNLRMSPKAEPKKRRAPALPGAPTPTMGHTGYEGYQMGSESQQRKRKAPAPPPTPTSSSQGPDDTLTSAAPTPDSHAAETPTPAFRSNVAQSATVSATTVVMQTVKPVPLKTAVQPPPVCPATPTPSSPTPSSSTNDSLAVQDSSSELSHSLDDSDLDQAASYCSTLTSSTASGSVQEQKSSNSRVEESEKASRTAAKLNQEATSSSSSRSETESALNLKLDDVDNNRHSAMGTADRPAPPKPRRSPSQEPTQLDLPPTLPSPPIEPTESSSLQSPVEAEEVAPQSWLHSMHSATASCRKPETGIPEEETVSLGSSSGGSSLPDQGYAASEGMAEGEDSGIVSSPSDTQPTSPDGSLSLDVSSGVGGERLLGPVRDNSSDSDEGCATWGSRHRHKDISPQAKSGRLKDCYEDDPELTAQLHQTLADFEADLADHIDIVSAKETPYTMSTDSNEVPVSVVDMDVPVTAIDEVLEDYERHIVENETKSQARTESAGNKGPGFCQQSSVEPQNKNNNACTAADSKKSSSANAKPSQPEQHRKSQKNKPIADKKEEKKLDTKNKEISTTDTNSVKENKQNTSAVKSNVDMQKQSKSTEIKADPEKSNTQSFQEKKSVLPPTSQKSMSAERDQEMHRVYQNNSSSNTSHGKITRNVTSRFGLKTFTVVPPKPCVTPAATGEPAVKLTVGAIKIDDQGNMVKGSHSQNKVGGSSESGVNSSEGSPLLGKAKAFWSSNERQESPVPHSKDLVDKAKESMKMTPIAISVTTLKSSHTEDLNTMQTSFYKPAERAQPKEMVKEEAKEAVMAVTVAIEEVVEVESKISVSKNVHQPSIKPTLPPPILPDLKRDLSFLKPSRRTSSQYVASAITKYTPRTPVKPNPIPNVPDSSASLNSQTIGFQRSGRSIKINPHQSSQASMSDNKENHSAFKLLTPGPKRSMSFPEYMSDSQREFGEVSPDRGGFRSCVGSTKGSSNTLETETAKTRHIQSSGPTQNNTIANNDSEIIKHVRLRSPSPAQSRTLHSSAKPPTVPKTISQDQISNTKDATKTATHPTPDAKPQPSVTVTDSVVTPGPPPVTLFGPVKKFRPVISRSVDKDTSLHSSLMEAIQTGGGRDRLKKITTSGPSNVKKAAYVEEENERSALLAAIRAPSSSGKLRKTKSEAADELERFKKETSEEERGAGPPPSPSPPSLTCTSSPVFTPPPPPPPPTPAIAPPPPPPVWPQGKPSTVAHPSANAPVNPALAREAMLEAIRSGSAAERLKKVAAPTKTIQVNGRLGTIQATSSALSQQ
ncbi:protein cordon-bleu isoform X2 [Centropristis striata]|nr:protein cordon-bleu isoform X2 [Centropristis striata]XP_059195397.1 protein cordon-bleu isoform X2 [Centropristis striata]